MAISKQRENSLTDYKELILIQLEALGKSRSYIWFMILICLTPSIFNGFHASSYIFLTHMPDDYWCTTAELGNLTATEIRAITLPR